MSVNLLLAKLAIDLSANWLIGGRHRHTSSFAWRTLHQQSERANWSIIINYCCLRDVPQIHTHFEWNVLACLLISWTLIRCERISLRGDKSTDQEWRLGLSCCRTEWQCRNRCSQMVIEIEGWHSPVEWLIFFVPKKDVSFRMRLNISHQP